MNTLIVIAAAAVLAVLVAGVVLMGLGGKANEKYGNKLMVARVSLQGLVLVLLALAFAMGRK